MTEREPDPLYDALRERLTDYGQEPPAPLWASIRAQLPPPVAAPVLRTRRRWRWALLSLLLLLMSGGGWQWWQRTGRNAGPRLARHVPTSAPVSSHPAVPTTAEAPAPGTAREMATAQTGRPEQPALPQPATAGALASEKPAADSRTANGYAPTGRARTVRGSHHALQGNTLAAGPLGSPASRIATTTPARIEATTTGQAGASSPAPTVATTTDRAGTVSPTPTVAMTTDRAGAVSSAPAVATIASAAAPPATAATAGAAIGLEHAARPRSRYAASRVAALATAASLSAGRPAATAFHFPGRSRRPSLSRSKPGLVATTDHALQVRASAQNAEPAAGRPAGLAHLASIVSANRAVPAPRPEAWLTDQATARPEQLAWLKNPPGLPALGPARWAVQVLAGPSLTYRQLSSAGQPNSPSPPSGPAAGYNYAILPNPDVTSLERPALAGGGEVSLRRNLNQTWSITAGLGYVEYATRLALQLVKPAATSYQLPAVDSTLTSIHRRDTYHFVTVPVRVGYSWAITPRWRAGVLAGADVALYVGGRTTEGSACACQSQTWGLSDSPYRRLSLGLSLGAEARYRINGRWELLAQPTLSYLVTPLGSSSAASSTIALARTYTQRYPFGGALLLGAAYDLP